MAELSFDTRPILVNTTNKTDMPSGRLGYAITVLEEAVIAAAKDGKGADAIVGTITTQTFPAGTTIEMELSTITLTSGSVLVHIA